MKVTRVQREAEVVQAAPRAVQRVVPLAVQQQVAMEALQVGKLNEFVFIISNDNIDSAFTFY